MVMEGFFMRDMMTKLGKGGRLVIPASCRKALGISEGDQVILRLVDGELRLTPPGRAIKLAQSLVRRYVPQGSSLVEELIAERREEYE